MKVTLITLFVLFMALIGSSQSIAHHAFSANFKADETSTIEGTITEFRFRNPHVLIFLDVTDDNGGITSWMAEGLSLIHI